MKYQTILADPPWQMEFVKRQHGENPIEVFASLGKSGSCSKCQMEAITRCISTGLQYGVPLDNFVKQLQGISCPQPSFNGGKDGRTLSCPDAIARVLEEYAKTSP